MREGVLAGKGAIVTGGSSGIGRATALLFAQEGAAVLVFDIDRAGAESVVAEITDTGGKGSWFEGDVSVAADCQAAVDRCVDEFGRIDILFNNAGIIHRGSVVALSEEDWDRAMSVNVKSMFLMSKFTIPLMAKSGGGTIVNTSSGWGMTGGKRAASYCASKGAVVQLTKAMALDHGEQNIRVNCVCPGDTDTQMLRNEALQLGEPVEDFLSAAADRPLLRIGQPEDIARAVLYLASDTSSFVTGTSLIVDGGGLAGTA
ncbi:MAG: SDR family oxidoreductase [Gemmatimonadota bacterium]|nr:MAG: SDR family oxidoreductase [Gemmatimonadota bacterium]